MNGMSEAVEPSVERRQLYCLPHMQHCLHCATPPSHTLTRLYCMTFFSILHYSISASGNAMYIRLLLLLLLLKLITTLLTDQQLKAASSNVSC
jgi:hypothetical protein